MSWTAQRDQRSAWRPIVGLLLAALVLAHPGITAAENRGARDDSPAVDHLRKAFANRYELDTTQRVRLILRNRAGAERNRALTMATKLIQGRLHSLGRFVEPDYLRGTSILVIENRDRSDDHFVYLPSQGRIRRVSSAQRADSFMGTDFSYEDFERRYVDDYVVEGRGTTSVDDEPVVVVAASPRYDSAYRLTEFLIASADFAILGARYYQGPRDRPVRILRAPRKHMQTIQGHVLPTLMQMENLVRGTTTEAQMREITVNPALDDSLFTSSALETGRPIPILPENGSGAGVLRGVSSETSDRSLPGS